MKRLFLNWLRYGLCLGLAVLVSIRSIPASAQLVDSLTAIEWSPDGSKIAGGDINGDVYIWAASYFTELNHFHAQSTGIYSIAWNPTSTEIAVFESQSGQIGIWDINRMEQVTQLQTPPSLGYAVGFLDWSSHDVLAAIRYVSEGDDNIHLWDAHDNRLVDQSLELRAFAYDLNWNPDGSELAIADRGSIYLLDDFSQDALIRPLSPYSFSTKWNPASNQIAAIRSEGFVEIISMLDGQVVYSIEWDNNRVASVAWSPDGKTLAMLEEIGQVRLFDLMSEQIVASFQLDIPGVPRVMEWSPFGGRLVVGNPLNGGSEQKIPSLPDRVESVGDNQLRVIVPLASLDWLGQVASYCVAAVDQPSDEVLALLSPEAMSNLTLDQLPDFIEGVKALPGDTIPPACAADVIAVAEALQS
ncbi:MAG TPA: WD40 repeat domain-containing protein [Phototrophicaceae bacterium]|nr:WD40 repeat domain-containing protein [Phototrophicaceae bacterium]